MLAYRLLRKYVRGNKGSLFVLAPEPEPDDAELEALLRPPPPPLPPVDAATLTKGPVLICPAQFGTKARILKKKKHIDQGTLCSSNMLLMSAKFVLLPCF